MPIPGFAIPILQGVFQAEQIPASAITPQGEIDWGIVAANIVTDVELRTTILPPYAINLKDGAQGGPPGIGASIGKLLKPTLILSGPKIGRIVVAPYGETEGSWAGPVVVGGLLAALGWYWLNR